jgi:hypothetical protein
MLKVRPHMSCQAANSWRPQAYGAAKFLANGASFVGRTLDAGTTGSPPAT